MCDLNNSDAFGAPRQGGIGSILSQSQPSPRGGLAGLFRPSARGPAALAPPVTPVAPAPTGLASLFRPSARGPAAPVTPAAPTGLASVTPSARGPRNRRRGLEF